MVWEYKVKWRHKGTSKLAVLQELKFCCYNQIPWQQWQPQWFLQQSPIIQLLVKCQHDSTGNEHESASQYWQERGQQRNCELAQPTRQLTPNKSTYSCES